MLEDEWRQARIGKVGASRVADILARTMSGWGASRANYEAELIAERLTGEAAERYTSAAMQHGSEVEAEARAAYAFARNVEVTGDGHTFIPHPDIADFGASPDGFVGDDGLVEIKCPNTATHLATLLGNAGIKGWGTYYTQMHAQMACTGRAWCDFVSYDPRLPERLRMVVKRVPREDALVAKIEAEVRKFLDDLAAKMVKLERIAA